MREGDKTTMLVLRSGLVAVLLVACAGAPPPPHAGTIAPTPAPPPTVVAAEATTAAAGTVRSPPPAPSSSPATAPAPEPTGTAKERLMRSHFRSVSAIRKAILDGSLADAVGPAETLANNQGLGKIDPSWQSSIDVLEFAARRIQRASDIPAVAAAIADIGIACGACHKAAGGPTLKQETLPSADGTLASRMRRHVWANERLWEGIYAPSDASWKRGAEALGEDPFPKEVLDAGGVHARSAASRFRSLAAALPSKKTPQDRAQAYAPLLETCSACHIATRKK